MSSQTKRFAEVKAELLRDPKVQQAYDELEPAYQLVRARIMRGLTQAELAKKVGTKQPSIARLESGQSHPSLAFLQRVVDTLGCRLEIRIVPNDTRAISTPKA